MIEQQFVFAGPFFTVLRPTGLPIALLDSIARRVELRCFTRPSKSYGNTCIECRRETLSIACHVRHRVHGCGKIELKNRRNPTLSRCSWKFGHVASEW